MRKRSNKGLFQRLLEAGSRTTYHGKIRTRGGKRAATVRAGKQSVYKGVRIIPLGNGEFETSLDSSRFDSKRDAKRFVDSWKKQGNPRKNPTKSLTLAQPKDFYASGWGSETAPAGTKVSVAWSPGIGMATVYWRKAGRLFESVLDAGDIPGMFRRWPAEWALSNPRGKKGDFSRCVKAVSQRKGAKDPNAICAAQERKAGKLNRSGPPGWRSFYSVGSWRNDKRSAQDDAKDFKAQGYAVGRIEQRDGKWGFYYGDPTGKPMPSGLYAKDKRTAKKHGIEYYPYPGYKGSRRPNPAASARAVSEEFHGRPVRDPNAICAAQERKAGKLNPEYWAYSAEGHLLGSISADSKKEAKKIADRWYPEYVVKIYSERRNPAASAQAVSEEFHGRPVREMVPVQQKRHYHKYLAELGELRKLVVESRDGKHRVTLSGFKHAMLCTNEDKNQLFIVGGDQSVNLKDFGIKDPHETETLGEVTRIEYFTDKEHLGDEGGQAVYVHKFRSTNDNGRHKTVRMSRNPDLIYYLRDEHLEFSGGSYFIRAEGIDL